MDSAVTAPGGRRRIPLHWQMLIGFLVGLTTGLIAHFTPGSGEWLPTVTNYVTGPIGQIFLRLIFMLVIPLLVSALIIGVADMDELASLKRIGIKTLIYTLAVSAVAVTVALLAVNILRPGDGVDPAVARSLLASAGDGARSIIAKSGPAPDGVQAFLAIIPTNIISAMSTNDILGVMFFAFFFGIGLVLVQTPETAAVKTVVRGIFDVSMRLITMVIHLAPIAIACFMFNLAGLFGWDLLIRLSAFVGTVLLAIGIQMFVVYPILLRVFAKRSGIKFFRDIQEAMVMAFATASSNATLPTALKVAEEDLRLPKRISRFVLTIGATANQNGSAMFEGLTVVFLAQIFGVDLTLQQQLGVMLICIAGSVGTAGVPAATLPVIAMILASLGVPPEGIGLVLGVDRFLDMCRTTLNVTGDLVAATVVSAGEPSDEEVAAAEPA